jgi:spermidine synthase
MSARFQELDWQPTPMGDVTLRRRRDPGLGIDVYEVKLGDEYLMSSLFPVAEIELARLGLAAAVGDQLDVVVGGLGLGYTARAALEDPRVRRLHVVEAVESVIDWQRRGLLPGATELTGDPRTTLVHADFFALAAGSGFEDTAQADGAQGADGPTRWHAILLDIDHTPEHLLDDGHADFYSAEGLRRLVRWLHPGGVFALWSDAAPDPSFLDVLGAVFETADAVVVEFPNHLTGGTSANTVYVARLR